MDDFVDKFRQIRIGGEYQLICRIGGGSFGAVYLGRNVVANEEVAIKLEHHSVQPSLLREEIEAYSRVEGKNGFPTIFWTGAHDDFQVMVLELLGPNLEDLFQYCGGVFSLKTTLMIADQLIYRFEHLHKANFLHRDVKPENFLMGRGRQGNCIYMTDFGLATYRRPDQKVQHVPATSVSRLLGTARYASVRGHLGLPQSQRDDLEALGYMLVYFIRGRLPWQGIRAADRQKKYQLILEQKRTLSVAELCHDLPPEFATYMDYVRGLPDEERPNYGHLRKLFRRLFQRQCYEYDQVFDWTILEYNEQNELSPQAKPTKKRMPGRKGAVDDRFEASTRSK